MTGKSVYTCPFCGHEHSRILDLCPESKKRVPEVYRFEGLVIDDKYKLDRRIAEGGMGVVYAGTHLSIGRKIAVKFLHSEIATSEDLITRFKNEARLAASIGHRNIVDIIDMGMLRRRIHYIVMEFLEGMDLDTTLSREGRFTQEEATDLVIQILNGLKAAHRKGIVHRDLKPENIFLVTHPDGERYVKILDFGISKLLDDSKVKDVKLTHTGMVFGTPRYMSPEQARGRTEVDHRADLYAVGAIYYEMLCAVPLFVADNYNELIVDVLTNQPVHVLERNPELSPDLAALVMKAVSKEPVDRFQNAAEFIEAIAAFSSSPIFTRSSSGEIYFSDGRVTFTTGQVLDRKDRTPSAGRGKPSPIPVAPQPVPENLKAEIEAFSRLPTVHPDALHETGDDILLMPEESDTNLLAGSGSWSLRPSFPPQDIENSQVHIRPAKRSRAVYYLTAAIAAAVAVVALWGGVHFYAGLKTEAQQPAPENVVVASAAAVKAVPELVDVAINDLPVDAKVYIDDILHAERPVKTELSSRPRRIKVMLGAETLLDENVVIMEGMALSITYPEAVEETGQDDGQASKAKAKKKKKSKKADESPSGKKKRSIDMVYPL